MTISEMGRRLRAREFSVRELTQQTLDKIEAANPALNAFITVTHESALERADELDAMLQRGEDLGPLHGIPILIKDNIETADPMPTTAGSLALAHNMTRRDAPVVARLKALGPSEVHRRSFGPVKAALKDRGETR